MSAGNISFKLPLAATTLLLLANLAYSYDYVPAVLKPKLTVETRQALGCLDEQGGKLLSDYRTSYEMAGDHALEPADHFQFLSFLSNDASTSLKAMQDCYTSLIKADAALDRSGAIRESMTALGQAYESIFLAQAVSISKSIRESVGVVDKDVKAPPPDAKPVLRAAEAVYAAMSARIGAIVTR